MWYEYPSNYSNGTEVNGLGSFIQYTNYIVNDYLGMAILLLIFLLTFGFSLVGGTKKALLVSSFITFLLSIPLVRMGIVPIFIPIALIVLVIIGAIIGDKDTGL
jgi:hypothetical protein